MLKSKTTGAIVRTKSANWNPTTGEWMIDGGVLADAEQDYEFVQDAPTVSVTTFKLLLAPVLVNILATKATDPHLQALFYIIDDPRTTEVDLSLATVEAQLDYLVMVNLMSPEQKAHVMAGKVT